MEIDLFFREFEFYLFIGIEDIDKGTKIGMKELLFFYPISMN